MTRSLVPSATLLLSVLALACSPAPRPGDGAPTVVRLADRFAPEMLVDPAEVVEPERSEWTLADLADGWTWRAPVGVEGATIGPDGLAGTVSTPSAVVVFEAPEDLGSDDRLYAIELRMKVSEGKALHLTALHAEGPPAEAFGAGPPGQEPLPIALSIPLVPGDEPTTYRIEMAHAMVLGPFARTGSVGRVIVRPSDVPGAAFEIESVRLIFRHEHLAAVPSGLGWHGLGEIWRETLVSRPGETLRVPLTVPTARPVLDLAMGTPEDAPMHFEVGIRPAGGQPGEGELRRLTARTITRPERWEEERVDLADWAGKDVELVLSATSEAPRSVALWGSGAVRSRGTGPAAAGAEAPQGVILVICDTLRRDHLDAWGYERETAPTLTRLAEGGVRFADTVAQAPWTKVSVPSILSSLYPTAHGIVDFQDRLPASAVTLAESFRDAGYATLATSAWPFTGQMTNLHQGVEVLHEGGSVDLPEGASRTKTARFFTDRLLEFVERHREEPFLAVVHTGDPHAPYEPMGRYADLWTEPGSEAIHDQRLEKVRPLIEAEFFRNFDLPTAADLARAEIPMESWRDHEIGWYDGSIRSVDAEIGRLIDRLDALGLTDKVVLAFVSDHGEEFFEHGINWHGQSLYGHQTDVPFVLWGPGFVPAGVTVSQPVQLIDVAPTLLALAGIERPETAQGRDLRPLVDAVAAGEAPEARGFRVEPVFSERTVIGIDAGFPPNTLPTSWAVITHDWRLIRNPGAPEGVPEYELYDRRTDPLSLHDVAPEHADVVERLAKSLAGWRAWVDAHKLSADAGDDLSAEDLERLRSLGYI